MQKIIKIEIITDYRSILIQYSIDDISHLKMAVLDEKVDNLIRLYEKGKFRNNFIKMLNYNCKNSSRINEIVKCVESLERPEEKKKIKFQGSSFGRIFTRKKPEKEIRHSHNDDSYKLLKSIYDFKFDSSDPDLRSNMYKISKWSNAANDSYNVEDLGKLLDNLLSSSVFQHEHRNDFRDITHQNALLKIKLDYLQTKHREISERNMNLLKTLCIKFGCLPDFTVILMNYLKEYNCYKRPADIEMVIYKLLIDFYDLNKFDVYSMTIYQLNYYYESIVKDTIDNAHELAKLISTAVSFIKVQHSKIREICKNMILTSIMSSII